MKAKVNIKVGKAPSLHLFHTVHGDGGLPTTYRESTTFTGSPWLI